MWTPSRVLAAFGPYTDLIEPAGLLRWVGYEIGKDGYPRPIPRHTRPGVEASVQALFDRVQAGTEHELDWTVGDEEAHFGPAAFRDALAKVVHPGKGGRPTRAFKQAKDALARYVRGRGASAQGLYVRDRLWLAMADHLEAQHGQPRWSLPLVAKYIADHEGLQQGYVRQRLKALRSARRRLAA